MNRSVGKQQIAILGGGLGCSAALAARALQEHGYGVIKARHRDVNTGLDFPKPSETFPEGIVRPIIERAEKVLANSQEVTDYLKRVRKNHYKNTECFCDSGRKLKKCCRQLPEPQLRIAIARLLSGVPNHVRKRR
ncbi:SEC-C motif protein [Vibrio phage 1.215.B._10N.222.54.F7]|nr:SEC-C motif protein [Vibrio phage 1.215.A._10N.222.54.F7]AUR96048.1 SEC-C motif protein [Vibrio phage 1.215.B._10N.222.54.F7]